MPPRTPIADLRLQGSPNLGRALRREANEARPPSAEVQKELDQVNDLIEQAIAECHRGQSIEGKRNPAFANLATLVKLRRALLADRDRRQAAEPTTEELLAEGDRILGGGEA